MTDSAEGSDNEPLNGLSVSECANCGTHYFPRRLVCRRCGTDAWIDKRIYEAVIEESTTVLHVVGGDGKPRYLATVCTQEGPRIIVGLEAPSPDGTRVALLEKNGAPLARAIDG
jgi:uncharacterized OB-fold protein